MIKIVALVLLGAVAIQAYYPKKGGYIPIKHMPIKHYGGIGIGHGYGGKMFGGGFGYGKMYGGMGYGGGWGKKYGGSWGKKYGGSYGRRYGRRSGRTYYREIIGELFF